MVLDNIEATFEFDTLLVTTFWKKIPPQEK